MLSSSAFASAGNGLDEMDILASEIFATLDEVNQEQQVAQPTILENVQPETVSQVEEGLNTESVQNFEDLTEDDDDKGINKLALQVRAAIEASNKQQVSQESQEEIQEESTLTIDTPVEPETTEISTASTSNDEQDEMAKLASQINKTFFDEKVEETHQEEEVQSPENIKSETIEEINQDEMAKLAQEVAGSLFEEKQQDTQEENQSMNTQDTSAENTEEQVKDEMSKLADELSKALFEEQKTEEIQEQTIEEPEIHAEIVENTTTEEEQDEMNSLAEELEKALSDAPEQPAAPEQQEEEEEEDHHEEEEEEEEDPGQKMEENNNSQKPYPRVIVADECSAQLSEALHEIYNFGIDALELDSTNIKLDYENLETITKNLNTACYKNFALNMSPKSTGASAGSCQDVLDGISNIVISFTGEDASDNFIVVKTIQDLWYQNSKFIASCLPQEEQEIMPTNCLLSFAEAVSVLYQTSETIKDQNTPYLRDNIKNLEGKLDNMNSYCDAKYKVELDAPTMFSNGSCEEGQMLLQYALEVFMHDNTGDVDYITKSLNKVWSIARQVQNDCQN